MNNNYPEHILRVLRERNDLEEDDTSMDEEFQNMAPARVLKECLEWEGISGYGSWLMARIYDIYGIHLDGFNCVVDKEDKAKFVRGFGNFMRHNTGMRTEIMGMEMDEHEIVTIHYEGGGTHKANIHSDSELAALRDILKNAE